MHSFSHLHAHTNRKTVECAILVVQGGFLFDDMSAVISTYAPPLLAITQLSTNVPKPGRVLISIFIIHVNVFAYTLVL